jgi:hypothetical protein
MGAMTDEQRIALHTRAQATLAYPYAHPDAKGEAGDVLEVLAALERAEAERNRARETADQLNDDMEQWHSALGPLLADTPEGELEEVLGVRAALLIARLERERDEARTQAAEQLQASVVQARRDLQALREAAKVIDQPATAAIGQLRVRGETATAGRLAHALTGLRRVLGVEEERGKG